MRPQFSVWIDARLALSEMKPRNPDFVDRLHLARGNSAPYPHEFPVGVQLAAQTFQIKIRKDDDEFFHDPFNITCRHLVWMGIKRVRLRICGQHSAVSVDNVCALLLAFFPIIECCLCRPPLKNNRCELAGKNKETKAKHHSTEQNSLLAPAIAIHSIQPAPHSCPRPMLGHGVDPAERAWQIHSSSNAILGAASNRPDSASNRATESVRSGMLDAGRNLECVTADRFSFS